MAEVRSLASVDDAAEFLGVPKGTLAQWRYLGKGPRWSKIGRYARYRWEDLQKYVDENAKGGDR
ncbi:helix-turn-helix domain-containing protein [Glycomyces sp. L485]|uniref:helix-turn-helix transcriptional regulator n=1 Tax=Glycomyces sp. L485 TaxID=2909235 RepID=UPI001F4A86B8|nr:helix-turn-helix domain-containing protein [Glycomyces sp. L485]MCH7231164.1 helix-turn-helix domain-containing protein [Glycomyces sp. L485]